MKSINWHLEISQVVFMHQMWVPWQFSRFYRTIYYNIHVLIMIMTYEVICHVTRIILYTIWTIRTWYHKLYDAIDQLASREELSGACMFIQASLLRPSTRCSILSDNLWASACFDDDYDGDKVIWCVVNMITLTNVRWLSC